MPDIDFNLDSSVGDHKITNGHIALFLISRLKVQKIASIFGNFPSIILFYFVLEHA